MNKKARLAAVLVATVMAGYSAIGSAEGMAFGRSQAPAPLEELAGVRSGGSWRNTATGCRGNST